MQLKQFEIRDRHTSIPAVAFDVSSMDGFLARRAGFTGPECSIFLVTLGTEHCAYDPFHWGNRTLREAHIYIRDNWKNLPGCGEVVDVEFILGETSQSKASERFESSDEVIHIDEDGAVSPNGRELGPIREV